MALPLLVCVCPSPYHHTQYHRFAETRLASNPGARYRDWVCLAYTRDTMAVEKARLESHIIDNITETYETCAPLPFGDKQPQCQFFVRASTRAAEEGLQWAVTQLVTHSSTVPDSSFHAFARAVRTLVLSPAFASKTGLELVSKGRDKSVTPGTVYSDPIAKQVLFVYTPASGQQGRLEFIQFCFMGAAGRG